MVPDLSGISKMVIVYYATPLELCLEELRVLEIETTGVNCNIRKSEETIQQYKVSKLKEGILPISKNQ